jgi:hypothetical protein
MPKSSATPTRLAPNTSVSKCTWPNTHTVTDSAAAQPTSSDSAIRATGRSARKAHHTSAMTAASEPQPMVFISRLP